MTVAEPQRRKWSKAEFHQMADLGWFIGQRAELIAGQIVVLSPQNFPHAATTDRVAEILRARLPNSFWVRMQLPLDLGQISEPEPDVSVVPGRREKFHDHPTNAVLVVEVSESTLAFDRGDKAMLYAAAGVADYWIVNLMDEQVEVHRQPIAATQSSPARYGDIAAFRRGQTINLLAATISICVDDFLG